MRDAGGSDVILERLLGLHPKIIDLTLDRVWRLLADLGDPQARLAPVVHIAGTNGKGSVLAMIRAGVEAAGQGAHCYTSPHLAYFHERIRIAGRLIGEDALSALLEECETANAGRPITFFEITTVAAILAFARARADWTLLEVGLGGRLDATNVVDRPALTVITPVSLDHQQYLGETLAEIAGEKAGILKPGVPCIVGPQAPEAMRVIEARAAEAGAPLLRAGVEWSVRREGAGIAYEDARGALALPRPALPGAHQLGNAGIALAAMRAMGLPETALAGAMTGVAWPARMQRLTAPGLLDRLPAGAELWLDGGHNPAAGAATAELLAEMAAARPAPVWLVAGMLETKATADYLAPLARIAAGVVAVPVPDSAAGLPARELAARARGVGLPAETAEDVEAALAIVAARATAPPRVLICGSLYLAGAVLRAHMPPA